MATGWLSATGQLIVSASNEVIDCEECPCSHFTGCVECFLGHAFPCSFMSRELEIFDSPITLAATVSFFGSCYRYEGTGGNVCGDFDAVWEFNPATYKATITLTGDTFDAVYEQSWQFGLFCPGTSNYDLISSSGCASFPATIGTAPVVECDPVCDVCYEEGWPDSWTMTLPTFSHTLCFSLGEDEFYCDDLGTAEITLTKVEPGIEGGCPTYIWNTEQTWCSFSEAYWDMFVEAALTDPPVQYFWHVWLKFMDYRCAYRLIRESFSCSGPNIMERVEEYYDPDDDCLVDCPETITLTPGGSGGGGGAMLRRNREPSHKPPGLLKQGASVTKAMAKWIAAGKPLVTPEQLAERTAACDACPHLRVKNGVKSCGLCGCSLAASSRLFGTVELPGKLEMATESCPDNARCKVAGCPGVPRWRAI